MAFVLYRPTIGRTTIRAGNSSRRGVRLYAGTKTSRPLVIWKETLASMGVEKSSYCRIMVDEDARQIALIPTSQPSRGDYAGSLHVARSGHGTLSLRGVCRNVGIVVGQIFDFELEPAPELGEGAWKFSYAEAVGG
jgi:hypothetical protein